MDTFWETSYLFMWFHITEFEASEILIGLQLDFGWECVKISILIMLDQLQVSYFH